MEKMKKIIFVLFIFCMSLTSCTIYTNSGECFPPLINNQRQTIGCQNWQSPICDNGGNSVQSLCQRGWQVKITSIKGVNKETVNSYSQGAVVDGIYHECGFTINFMVNNIARSIPISYQQWYEIYENNQTIEVAVVW